MRMHFRGWEFRSRLHIFFLVVTVAVILWCAATGQAQRIGVTYDAGAQTDAALKSLSPAAQAVMERLSRLGRQPVYDLRYYAGDDPNGEAVTFDDSGWQTVQLPLSASTGSVWLRKQIEVPKTFDRYDPTAHLVQPSL
jgi:hypothetical protein